MRLLGAARRARDARSGTKPRTGALNVVGSGDSRRDLLAGAARRGFRRWLAGTVLGWRAFVAARGGRTLRRLADGRLENHVAALVESAHAALFDEPGDGCSRDIAGDAGHFGDRRSAAAR